MKFIMLEKPDIKAFAIVSFRLSMKSEKNPSKNVIVPWSGLG
jgi:hypothetical protein